MIKVIAFDYAEVVAQGPITSWIQKNVPLNDERRISFKRHSKVWDTGDMKLPEMYRIISEITGVIPEKIWEEFYEKSLPNDEVIMLIKNLKKHYKIILFSNFFAELLRRLLDKHKIADLFDEIIISSEHKMIKPNFDFFELLLAKSGVKKTEIIFTDDRKDNIDASNAFGIKAIQFLSAEQLIKDLRAEGVKINH
jgi:HAD superfamily hydrolase (TIGR01509 family)